MIIVDNRHKPEEVSLKNMIPGYAFIYPLDGELYLACESVTTARLCIRLKDGMPRHKINLPHNLKEVCSGISKVTLR